MIKKIDEQEWNKIFRAFRTNCTILGWVNHRDFYLKSDYFDLMENAPFWCK